MSDTFFKVWFCFVGIMAVAMFGFIVYIGYNVVSRLGNGLTVDYHLTTQGAK